jgi:hypothetical protein
VGKRELAGLEEEIMVPADADHVLGRGFGKPAVGILKGPLVLLLDIAEIPAVDQEVTRRNGDLPVLPMRVGDDAEGFHFLMKWQCRLACSS